jgi:putative ABC transport system permease protein
MIQRLEDLPGVQSVGASTSLPLHPASVSDSFGIVGRPAPESGVWPHARYDSISPGYFQTMGVPLLKGRMFSEPDDVDHPPVMIINETMARRYWPGEEPIGQQVALGSLLNDGSRAIFDVIGIVGDLHDTNLERHPEPCMYVCYHQQALRFMCFTLRTSVDPMSLVDPVRREVAAVTREEAPFEFHSTEELLRKTVRQRSTVTFLLCLFAGVGVGLSALGLYGVVSYSVARRTHEIGVRMAVGGQRGDVLRMVLKQGLVLTGAGLAVGVAVSLGATRSLATMLYEISPIDPLTFIAVALLLAVVALLACYMPARRAASVDPMVALRCE